MNRNTSFSFGAPCVAMVASGMAQAARGTRGKARQFPSTASGTSKGP
jgi:hypothetical protein